MIMTDTVDFHSHLPPYRSLLNPNAKYDYRTHSLIPLSQNELNGLRSSFEKKKNATANGSNGNNSTSSFKMKYKSLLSDVSRSISMRISNPNLLASSTTTISTKQIATSSKRKSPIVPSMQFKDLPIEIQDYVFYLVDSKVDYKSCMYTCKSFYFLAKPYYYQDLHFTTTYRFAQFISYLRLNSNVGQYVRTIDLSGIKPGYDEEAQEEEENVNAAINAVAILEDQEENNNNVHPRLNNHESTGKDDSDAKVLAGWRDWKFKTNPLYSVYNQVSTTALAKVSSNTQHSISSGKSSKSIKSLSSTRLTRPFKYFKRNKSNSNNKSSNSRELSSRKRPRLETLDLSAQDSRNSILARNSSVHPLISKFLLQYSSSKDIPIGYVLHLINLCPNVESINLGNLCLSMDYEISRSMVFKYQNFDIMNNYPKDLVERIDNIMKSDEIDDVLSYDQASIFNLAGNSNNMDLKLASNLFKSSQSIKSAASSLYELTTFSKPTTKYNSLLSPLPSTVSGISYLNKGDGKVYLSDLNLKSINSVFLKKIKEDELLMAIIKMHGKKGGTSPYYNYNVYNNNMNGRNLKYLNLSSMIWLNQSCIQSFLSNLLLKHSPESLHYQGFSPDDDYDMYYSDLEDEEDDPAQYRQDLVLDLTDSGMYKNLPWARRIDLNTIDGCRVASKIINNSLLSEVQEIMRRERIRRGRIGENYLT
ncbi:COS111 [[Candida] subhashii]|uniref:COS111 n=1 Tax=[Candida] subhashii TaxID=561895 RepID=A0A8J5UQ42_9ASCO|nr:COS111 [[Candida] subhashii]KAG7664471.1 COS111 [[Candida] subhashii]